MPQMAPFVLKDRADPASPANFGSGVSHTFKPRNVSNGVVELVETTGVPIGERRLTMSQNRTASGRAKVVVKMSVPVVQDVVSNGVSKPTVVRTNYVDVTFNFDPTSSTQERHNTIGLLESLIAFSGGSDDVKFSLFAVDLEGFY